MNYLEKVELISKSKDLQEIEYEKCRRDPWYWLQNWVFTLDSHDLDNPVKKFPSADYLKVLTYIWAGPTVYPQYNQDLEQLLSQQERDEIFVNWSSLMVVPKSRQMKVSWWATAVYLWNVEFYPGAQVFFQSKKEEDADNLIKRSKFMYDHQPFFLKRNAVNPGNRGEHTYCKLEIPEINSFIKGIPEGGDQIRMHTATGIFSDETAFQPSAEDAFTAAKPTIDGGGRFTAVSTANPGFFHLLVEDKNR